MDGGERSGSHARAKPCPSKLFFTWGGTRGGGWGGGLSTFNTKKPRRALSPTNKPDSSSATQTTQKAKRTHTYYTAHTSRQNGRVAAS